MNEAAIDNDPIGERVPIEFLIENMPELKTNPFSPRLCQVFSSADDNKMNFEDFLDMTSVLSDGAPIQVKADWAFRVFGKQFGFFSKLANSMICLSRLQ